MSANNQILFRWPPEFIDSVLIPWHGGALWRLGERIVKAFSTSGKPKGTGQMLERNQKWRQAFKERFEQIFEEMESYRFSPAFQTGIDEGIRRMEAWMIVTDHWVDTKSWREHLSRAAFVEGYVQENSEEAMRQIFHQFGTPRRYRTPSGLDRYYLRIEKVMKNPLSAREFAARVWSESGWYKRIFQTLRSLLEPCRLGVKIQSDFNLPGKESMQ